MGKDLTGRELGQGLSQRKDGRYSARITINKKRVEKYFKNISAARRWMRTALYEAEYLNLMPNNITVQDWYEYWIENVKKGTVRNTTVNNYEWLYSYIKDEIGLLKLKDVKPVHCQKLLNDMHEKGYACSTITLVRNFMKDMFQCAQENYFIISNPVKPSVRCKKTERKERKILTVNEQKLFLEVSKNRKHHLEFALILQTGLRVSELRGLKWSDIDLENSIIKINRTLVLNEKTNTFEFNTPKTLSGTREIPITKDCKEIIESIPKIKISNINYAGVIFLNENGQPTTNTSYDKCLRRISNNMGIEPISIHCLRHTFATRCIEAGMKPKTLQKIMGHSDISTTMNLYVHVTEDEMHREMKKLDEVNCKMA